MADIQGQEKIVVSIFCLTYNHQSYIRDTLEGFLQQETDFTYEIFIYDDASTDGTSDIVREYEERYPHLITANICSSNTFNLPDAWRRQSDCRRKLKGKYIAICEGDDYWIDSHKLQRQVDYMEKHSECSLYMHNALWWDHDNQTLYPGNPFITGTEPGKVTIQELILQEKGHPATASFLYRREYEEMPDFCHRASIVDYPLQLFLATKGEVVYDGRVMSIYRWHTPGSYNQRTQKDIAHNTYFYMGIIEFLLAYDQYTEYQYHVTIADRTQKLFTIFVEQLDRNQSLQSYFQKSPKTQRFVCCTDEKMVGMLEQLKRQIQDGQYCSDAIRQYCAEHDEVWIMGTGRYATLFAEQLENNRLEIAGYMVSRETEGKEYFRGKEVLNIRQFAEKDGNVGLIVAINPTNRSDIGNTLEKAGIRNFRNPFLLEWRMD